MIIQVIVSIVDVGSQTYTKGVYSASEWSSRVCLRQEQFRIVGRVDHSVTVDLLMPYYKSHQISI